MYEIFAFDELCSQCEQRNYSTIKLNKEIQKYEQVKII